MIVGCLFILLLKLLQQYLEMIVNQPKKHSQVAHNFKNRYVDSTQLQKPTAQASTKSMKTAREKIDEILGVKKEASFGTNIQKLGNTTSEMVKFTAKGEQGFNKQRVARIDSVQLDPLAPPMHKHRKLPKGAGSPPPPLLRSPPRKLTQKDMADWKIPPCISNWKNSRGYTIPIHMRLAADGRSLQHNSINESFADIIDSLYVAERQSKLELEERAKIQRSVDYKQYIKKEEQLRKAAMEAREEFKKIQEHEEDEDQQDQMRERQEFRYHRMREIQREERMKKVGAEKKKEIKRQQRDISEKVALGQAQPTNQDLMYDQRLFDNAGGLQAGNSDSQDDNLYDKPLFADRSAVHAQTAQTGAKDKATRTAPVQFEMHKESIFGMNDLLSKPQKKVKRDQ